MGVDQVDLEGLVSWVSSIASDSYFYLLLFHRVLKLWREEFDVNIPFRAESLKVSDSI